MAPLISFRAVDVDIEGQPVDVPLPARWIDAALADANLATGIGDWEGKSGPGGGHVSGRVSRSGRNILVRGRVRAEVTLACSRCLGPAAVAVDGELSLLLEPASRSEQRHGPGGSIASRADRGSARRPSDGEYEFSAAEAELDAYDGETVVLDPFVREAILLELPQFPLCSAGCVGIPAGPSGADLVASAATPVDPRLAPLSALRTKLTGEPTAESTVPSDLAGEARPPDRSKVMLRSTSRRGLRQAKRKRRR